MTVALLLGLNAAVVTARTGDDRRATAHGWAVPSSARSASLGSAELDEPEPSVGAAQGEQAATGSAPRLTARPTTTAGPASTVRPPNTVSPSTTTTVAATTPAGVRGPGLYVVGSDGEDPRRLVEGYGMFTWSPDGTRLAYSGGDDLIVVRADGTGRTTLPAGRGALAPAWSPDGTRLAFSRSGGGSYVVRADGSGSATLVDPLGQLVGWTPDSRLVVISTPPSSYSSVIVYDAGGGRKVLASDGYPFVQPAPSPDGRLVAYMGSPVMVAAVDGSGSRPLTPMCCGSESVGSPLAWSPDSRQLAFIDQGDIKVVGADGAAERVLAPKANAPAWSPDGRLLALIDERVVRQDGLLHLTLQVMGVNGSDRHTVFDAGQKLGVVSPRWSPTGRQLAVQVIEGGPPRLP